MYVHREQLRHLLSPEAYYNTAQYEREVERLFMPSWHPVASRAELARSGDFLTGEILGRPFILRNFAGEIRAFENVCSHRHCRLTPKKRGRSERFACQYHGWEYTREGRTARIPDAGCFRPFDRENARLRSLRLESRGELLFLSIAESGPTLSDQLGSYDAACASYFAPPFRFAWRYEAEYAANWKIPTENTLEAYHIPCLHRKTFGDHPTEENTHHELDERFTKLTTVEPPTFARFIQNQFVRSVGRTPRNLYIHRLLHPHLVFIELDVMRMVQVFMPLSPVRCRHLVLLYTLYPEDSRLARLLAPLFRPLAVWAARMIILEDAPIFSEVQRGIEKSRHPGVLGTIEERVFVFQQYVSRALAGDRELSVSPINDGPMAGNGALAPLPVAPGSLPRNIE